MNKSYLAILCLMISIFSIQAQNLVERSVSDYSPDLSDLWGWSDGTNEYALLGILNAFVVIDVTDPDNPDKLFNVSVVGPSTFWRDIKTYGHYAYGVHDCSPCTGLPRQGLVIMDLSYLPDSMPTKFWFGEPGSGRELTEAHNIYIDEGGTAYLSGHDYGGSGVLMLDIATDPLNPAVVGQYQNGYVHDCFTRGDTLWTSDGNSNRFSAVDVSDKANPVLLGSAPTPGSYSHNVWMSDDGKTAFTTDESSGAFITAHDVSDITDIDEIDRYRSNPGSGVIPHNVHVLNDFLIISYYRDGIIILDAKYPDELVEVGRFDTDPIRSGNGFHGSWGAYPYLPSGNILASDIIKGMYVLTPEYKRAIQLRGKVTDASTGTKISGAQVIITIDEQDNTLSTDLSGKFKKGFATGGVFTIEVSKSGYTTYTDTRTLTNGDYLEMDIELNATNYTGNIVWNDLNENGLQDAGEPGIVDARVKLITGAGADVEEIISGTYGKFVFSDIDAGEYQLLFTPPAAEGAQRYIETLADAGDDAIDSDIQFSDGEFKTPVFTLTTTGSFLNFDAGFILTNKTDPVDTIHVAMTSLGVVTVCDESFENGLTTATSSSICGEPVNTGGSVWNADTSGCLYIEAGDATTEPYEICVVTFQNDNAFSDTTVFVVTIGELILSTAENAFDNGNLTLIQNPVEQVLYIKNNLEMNNDLTLTITDMSGRELLRQQDNGFNSLISMRVDGMSPGMYILSIISNDQPEGIIRFVKQ
ncbi:MAG: choice-of-anchor B family protein [Bacteroidetes bacterium]|nr:choice-of-anchor B family protein [Bacteroidota bacterium]